MTEQELFDALHHAIEIQTATLREVATAIANAKTVITLHQDVIARLEHSLAQIVGTLEVARTHPNMAPELCAKAHAIALGTLHGVPPVDDIPLSAHAANCIRCVINNAFAPKKL